MYEQGYYPRNGNYVKRAGNAGNKNKGLAIGLCILVIIVAICVFVIYRLNKDGVDIKKVKAQDITNMMNGVISDIKSIGKKSNKSSTNSIIDEDTPSSANTNNSPLVNEDEVSTSKDAQQITFNGSSISYSGSGANVNGSVVTITSAGNYCLSGSLEDGQVVVEAADSDVVKIILNNANITCKNSAPIYIKNADKTIITLESGSTNTIADGSSYSDTSEEAPTAAIYSKDDLAINGTGTLTVKGNNNNGIKSTNDLRINGGKILVTAKSNGLVGTDSVTIRNESEVNINALGAGIKAKNTEDDDKGYILFEGGNVSITSEEDGLNSNKDINIKGGNIQISAEDDGIHADATLNISGGTVDITKCYEGLESAIINVSGGKTRLVSSDDGVNAGGGNDSSSGFGPGGGGDQFSSQSGVEINISDGYLYVNANGDGLDSNGNLTITGGTVLVDGPTANNNGPLDANGTILVNGGTVLACGSSGMAEKPADSSTQYAISVNTTSTQSAKTLINIQDSSGKSIITYCPSKAYQSIVFSSPSLKKGETYSVKAGGKCTGTSTDGLYDGGTYSGGSELASLTLSSIVTSSGSSSGGGPRW